jgi:hypothetical protein
VTDNSHVPAAYVIVAAIITLVVPLRTRETAFCAAALTGLGRAAGVG